MPKSVSVGRGPSGLHPRARLATAPGKAVAHHAVENDVRPSLWITLVASLDRRDAYRPRNPELMRGSRSKGVGRLDEHKLDGRAPIVQASRRDERTATVATRARENGDPFAPCLTAEETIARQLREVVTSVLHHLEELETELLDHDAIDFDI